MSDITQPISLTPLAEYVDILYTRATVELTPIEGLRWWVELRPPSLPSESGEVRLRGYATNPYRSLTLSADMYAIQKGARVAIGHQEQVIDMHIRKFKELI